MAAAHVFYGPNGVGKFASSIWVAKRLICRSSHQGNCRTCSSIDNLGYPDLLVIQPEDKSIGISQVHALQQSLSLNPYHPDNHRVVIIDRADTLTTEAQSALLKLLEEPPLRTVIILVVDRVDALLPTINSRCQMLHFAVPSRRQLVEYLVSTHAVDKNSASKLAELSDGLPGLALTLMRDDSLRQRLEGSDALVEKTIQAGKFERLLIAAKLSQSNEHLAEFIQMLTRKTRLQLRSGNNPKQTSVHRLEAIEQFYRFRSANVNPKSALEGLLLEL
jgi:DNA polymerase III subunit delta'